MTIISETLIGPDGSGDWDPDSYVEFWDEDGRDSGGKLLTNRRQRVPITTGGVFTAILEPGRYMVRIRSGNATREQMGPYPILVPDSGTMRLWPLIASAVGLPADITYERLQAAVAAYVAANPGQGGGLDDEAIAALASNPATGLGGVVATKLDKTTADNTYAPQSVASDVAAVSSVRRSAATAFVGDSLTQINSNELARQYGNSFPTLACWFSNGRIVFCANAGVASDTVQMVAARIAADVIARKPSRCVVLAGSNSTTKGYAHFAAARLSYENDIIKALLNAGIDPILCTIPPRDFARQQASTGVNTGPAVYQLTAAWNTFVRSMAAKYRLTLVDLYLAVADPTTGNYKDGYTDDGVHWNALGAHAAATALKDALLPLYSNPAVPLEKDAFSLTNLSASPLFLGGLGSGTSGLYPPGWNGSGSGVATSIVNPTEGDGLEAGKWLQLVKTGATSVNVNMIKTAAAFATASGITPAVGDRIGFGFRYDLTIPTPDDGVYVSVSLTFRNSSAASVGSVVPMNQLQRTSKGVVWIEGLWPAGAVDVRLDVTHSASGNSTLKLGQMTIVDLTAMGVPALTFLDTSTVIPSMIAPPEPATPVPAKVVGLAAGTATSTTLPLSWTAVSGSTGYETRYRIGEGSWSAGPSPTGVSTTLTALALSTKYRVQVRPVNAGGYGPWSDILSASTAATDTVPVQVTNVTAGATTNNSIAFTWSSTPNSTGYETRYRTSPAGTVNSGPTVTSAAATIVSGAAASTAYDASVRATNAAGPGPWSDWVTASTAAAPVVLASDSFDRADTAAGAIGTTDNVYGGSTPLAWSASSQMQVLSNQVGASTLTTWRPSVIDLGVTNARVKVTIAALEGGLYGRYTDGNTYYLFRYDTATSKLILEKRVPSVTTQLWASAAGAFTIGQTIELSVQGSTITVWANGVQLTQVTDTAVTAGTLWGLRSAASGGTTFRLEDFYAYNF